MEEALKDGGDKSAVHGGQKELPLAKRISFELRKRISTAMNCSPYLNPCILSDIV